MDRTSSLHASGIQRLFKYYGNERKSKRPGIFCLEKGKQKEKVIRMHGKDEEEITILGFVIQVLVLLPRNQDYKMKLQRDLKKQRNFLVKLGSSAAMYCKD